MRAASDENMWSERRFGTTAVYVYICSKEDVNRYHSVYMEKGKPHLTRRAEKMQRRKRS